MAADKCFLTGDVSLVFAFSIICHMTANNREFLQICMTVLCFHS